MVHCIELLIPTVGLPTIELLTLTIGALLGEDMVIDSLYLAIVASRVITQEYCARYLVAVCPEK